MGVIIEAQAGSEQNEIGSLGAAFIAAPTVAACRQATVTSWLAGQPEAASSCLHPLFDRWAPATAVLACTYRITCTRRPPSVVLALAWMSECAVLHAAL